MRHVFTEEEVARGRAASAETRVLRRGMTKAKREAHDRLLQCLLAESVMPEWYPHG